MRTGTLNIKVENREEGPKEYQGISLSNIPAVIALRQKRKKKEKQG